MEERISDSEQNGQTDIVIVSKDTQLKTTFAKGFAKALKDHKELRDFIKTEALKQINKDYDVVYHVVKNKPVTVNYAKGASNAATLHELLLPYFENEAQLLEIENKLPLLTVFVPDLQEESFSAERWNTLNEVPFVAVRTFESNDIPIYGADGENFILEAEYMPDFPVVVIKDNERIVSDRNTTQFNSLDREYINSKSLFLFQQWV